MSWYAKTVQACSSTARFKFLSPAKLCQQAWSWVACAAHYSTLDSTTRHEKTLEDTTRHYSTLFDTNAQWAWCPRARPSPSVAVARQRLLAVGLRRVAQHDPQWRPSVALSRRAIKTGPEPTTKEENKKQIPGPGPPEARGSRV